MSDEERSEYTFTWKIKNYSACYQLVEKYTDSPVFSVENLSGSLWHLQFHPRGHSRVKKGQNYISCFLMWETSCGVTETPSIDFSLEIVDKMDKVLRCLKAKHLFKKESASWGWDYFMDIDEFAKEMLSWEEDVLTIRCRMQYDKLKKQTIFGSEACTIIDTDRRFFEWDVSAPILFEHSESVLFHFADMYPFEFTLTSLLKGLKILIELKEYDGDILSEPVMFKLTFCDSKRGKIISKRAEHSFKEADVWKFPDFITKPMLEACNHDSSKYEFKLKCEVYVSKKMISFSCIEKLYYKSSILPCADAFPKACTITTMQNDFRSLFINQKYFDVTIRAQNEEFRAHKLVLRVRSPVFEAMFDQDMLENETGVVNVTDVDGQTMKTFLEFLYTETVEKMDYESAMKLLVAADKYQVPSLVNECVSYLKSVLSVENACVIISIADSVNCECLKSYTFNFIISNAAKILVTPKWEQWIKENIELATKILSKLSNDLMTKYK